MTQQSRSNGLALLGAREYQLMCATIAHRVLQTAADPLAVPCVRVLETGAATHCGAGGRTRDA